MNRFTVSIIGLLLGTVLAASTIYKDDLFELRKNFEVFGALYEEIAVNYVDDVRAQPFMRAGIDAMLAELDPYTQYYDEADMVDMQLMQQRKIGTVGIHVGLKGGRLTVLAPENNAAAYKQGIRVGDIILQIGGSPAETLTIQEAYELLMGQPRTTVSVVIQRGGESAPRTFVLPRSLPRTQNVAYSGYLGPDSTDGIAYVRLDIFGNRAAREVKRTLRNMDREGSLKGIVLDLRNNPGGILGEAVDIVELFVPKGSLVVSTRVRMGDSDQEFRTDEDPLFPTIPVVVMIDQYSASASEIVAGALQDHDRAVILGETSFGKGLVQITRPLPHNTLLKLTISHYYLPTGRTIQSFELNSASARVAVPAQTAFKTGKNRPVRGGSGVEPDQKVESRPTSTMESALLQESAFFLYAGVWIERHCPSSNLNEPLGQEDTCLQTQAITFDEFVTWLSQSDIHVVTESDLMITTMTEKAKMSGFSLDKELVSLRSALDTQKANQLADQKESIERQIQDEIRSRLMSEQARHAYEISVDEWIGRANELVRDSAAVGRILN